MKGFPGLLNTLGALLDRSQTILQIFKMLKQHRILRMYAATLGCMYADSGCMFIKQLGACMLKRLGAKYAVVACKSMERLGACLTVFACLTEGSYTLHVYLVAWAQGPWPLAQGPRPLAQSSAM